MAPYRLKTSTMVSIINNWKIIAEKYHGRFRNILATSPAFIDPINTAIRRFELHIPMYGENLIFTTSENHYFKLEHRFKKPINFNIEIYPEDFFEKVSKAFGMQEIEVGNKAFDDRFIIKSSNPEITIQLLDKKVQEYMITSNFYTFNLSTENNEAKLLIMPYINEENKEELERFIVFSGYLIKQILELNKN